jgi:arsenate reductase
MRHPLSLDGAIVPRAASDADDETMNFGSRKSWGRSPSVHIARSRRWHRWTASLQSLGTTRIQEFVPLFVHRFARERLRALGQVEGTIAKEVPEVLFVCVQNAGRSQIAASLLDHYAEGRVHVRSAGSEPADQINPNVVQAMAEMGIDIGKEFPKPMTDEVVQAADAVITMGCGDACPIYPGKRYEDWEVDDPADADLEGVRRIRDDIGQRVQRLLADL